MAAAATTRPANVTTVSFSEDEINALFQKWMARSGWVETLEPYMADPMLVIQDQRVIVAGTLKDMNTLASVHFEPEVTADGKLDLQLVKVLGGKLPLPRAIWSSQRQKAVYALAQRLPEWSREAAIKPNGIANDDAVKVGLSRLLLNVLNERDSEPVIFLPVAGQGAVPARLVEVAVEEKTLSLTVAPMTAAERAAFLAQLKGQATKVVARR